MSNARTLLSWWVYHSLISTNNILIIILQKQIVKEGQVLCYIEQLGGELPIEVWVLTWIFILYVHVLNESKRFSTFPILFHLFFLFPVTLSQIFTLQVLVYLFVSILSSHFFFPPVWYIWGGHQDSTRGWWWVWHLWMSFYCWVFLQISLHMFSFGLLCFTDPVGYGDALIAILPSFPGIKKLQWFGQTFSCSFNVTLCSYTLQALYASSLYHFQLKMICLSFRVAIVWSAYRFSDYIEDRALKIVNKWNWKIDMLKS